MTEVIEANNSDANMWQEFLRVRNVSHHAYDWAWRDIFSDVFGHTPHYLIARENAEIRGILPLFYFKSILFGKTLISVPYLNAGGIIADSNAAFLALYEHAVELGKKLGVSSLELRHRTKLIDPPQGLVVRSHKVSMELALKSNAEELFASFPPKLRSQIRRPAKEGAFAQVYSYSDGFEAGLQGFYAVFSEHMRDLGTPVYPRKLFERTARAFKDRAKIVVVRQQGAPIAAGFSIAAGRSVEIPWASALRKYNRISPNMLLYWESIRAAAGDGYEIFDFGRSSPDTGTYRFKQQWGPAPLPLHWYYHIFSGSIPDVNPNSDRFDTMVRCWQRLPLRVANLVGPLLTKNIP